MKSNNDSIEDLDQQLVSVGEKLKELRIAKGYTSYEYFAFENNLNRSQYGTYERGRNMTLATLVKILAIHGLTLKEFFED